MSEPEGQELQDKLVTIWYVMDQYQRDVEQWHDQKRKLKEKKEYLEMNGTTSKVFTSVVVLFALFYLLLGFFTRNFSSFFMIVLLSVFYLWIVLWLPAVLHRTKNGTAIPNPFSEQILMYVPLLCASLLQ